MDTISRKVELATILGTLQATQTNFRYLSSEWTNNTKEEALLGVSLTGIMDFAPLQDPEDNGWESNLEALKQLAVATNAHFSEILGVNQAAAVTCVKPSGTVSQLVDSSSGIHPRYAPYYIRRVRGDINDPVSRALVDAGVPVEESLQNPRELVFSFPHRAPEDALCVKDLSAIEQLEHWKVFATKWCEHKPSVSIYVQEYEWMEVGAWVYSNWDIMNGVSFFPHNDHIYPQAPYEEITEEEYNKLLEAMPHEINLSVEDEDNTTGSQELACHGGSCEL